MELVSGNTAPDFQADTSGGKSLGLEDLRGKWVILYFYPKDDTPGCTREACGFRDVKSEFADLNAVILGCSPDDVSSHDKFVGKYELPFTLVSDTDHSIAENYGVWQEKNLYGKKSMGIVRSTFLIDPDGIVRKIWPRVRVDDHISEVTQELKELSAKSA